MHGIRQPANTNEHSPMYEFSSGWVCDIAYSNINRTAVSIDIHILIHGLTSSESSVRKYTNSRHQVSTWPCTSRTALVGRCLVQRRLACSEATESTSACSKPPSSRNVTEGAQRRYDSNAPGPCVQDALLQCEIHASSQTMTFALFAL